MKKLLPCIAIVVLFCQSISVQAQLSFDIKAGASLNEIHSTGATESVKPFETKPKIGYHLGIMANYEFSDRFGLQSGLLYASKGTSYDLEESMKWGYTYEKVEVEGYQRSTINYLEVPVLAVFKINKFQVFGGPYFAIAIGGKEKYDYTVTVNGAPTTVKGDRKIEPVFGGVECSNRNDYVNAFDFGGKLGVGYQIKPFKLSVDYSLGMSNLNPKITGIGTCPVPISPGLPPGSFIEMPKITRTNRALNVSVSYALGR
jgi:hypothetical protein